MCIDEKTGFLIPVSVDYLCSLCMEEGDCCESDAMGTPCLKLSVTENNIPGLEKESCARFVNDEPVITTTLSLKFSNVESFNGIAVIVIYKT